MTISRKLAAGMAAALAALALAAQAGAATIHVHPGESIQAAIDAASPGDRIVVHQGVYAENLTIAKHGLTLVGAPHEARPVLMPAAEPTPSPCNEPGENEEGPTVNGICVVGQFDPATFEPGDPVRDTAIRRFVVTGFSGFGIIWFNVDGITVVGTVATHNDGYGISGFLGADITLLFNAARANGEPGFYIGDSPEANAVVIGNRSVHNHTFGDGFLFRDASHGLVRGNVASGNCAGMLFVDTGAPSPTRDWTVMHNRVLHNSRACLPEGEEVPPRSGIGIALVGTQRMRVSENVVRANRPIGPSLVSGGIALVSGEPAGGAPLHGNVIARNIVLGNQPVDIFWDGSGTRNRFLQNHCHSSIPAWICD